jgi:hypothetical protein
MKKVILFLGLTIYCLTIFSQKTETFPTSVGVNYPIYLSQNNIVSNKDYPSNLKDSIIKIYSRLNNNDAEKILRSSLVIRDSLGNKDVILDSIYENRLKIYLRVIVDDGVVNVRTENVVNGTKTTMTNAYHFELRPLFIPYSEFRFIRIKKINDYYALDCVTKVTAFKSAYYGANKFVFKIDSAANEVEFIASLLYLNKNIKNSSFINY